MPRELIGWLRGQHKALVAYASDNETLQPGDVLGTGTVSYSCSVDLHRWPQVGERVRFEVAGIGTLEHTIVAGEPGPGYAAKSRRYSSVPRTWTLLSTTQRMPKSRMLSSKSRAPGNRAIPGTAGAQIARRIAMT